MIDAGLFRRLGATAYGFGLCGDRVSFPDFQSMVHGDDERVDQESLRLCTQFHGELRKLGLRISTTSIRMILRAASPRRNVAAGSTAATLRSSTA